MPCWTNAGPTTIDIAGFDTATFNGSHVYGVFNINYSSFLSGTAGVGFTDLTNMDEILGIYQTTELNYALATAQTFTGVGNTTTDGLFSTTLGDLMVSRASGNGTFTAAVPEPSALALLGLSTLGLVARRRRTA